MSAARSVYAVPSAAPPLYSCTVSPATAFVLPRDTRTVRFVSSVRPPLVRPPVMLPTLSVTDVIDGAPGAVVSTVVVKLPDAALALPAMSITFAVSVYVPSASAPVATFA